MCYYVKITNLPEKIELHYGQDFPEDIDYQQIEFLNGFSNPILPVATLEGIQAYQWGLLPFWAKDRSFQKKTLNAKIETIREKNAYKNYVANRCLLPVSGFYEWKHENGGKIKVKHEIKLTNQNLFSLGCIFANNTFSIVTTVANTFMSNIHNTKKRMPIILTKHLERDWLTNPNIEEFKQLDLHLESKVIH